MLRQSFHTPKKFNSRDRSNEEKNKQQQFLDKIEKIVQSIINSQTGR
jgi:hypothetical protein